MSFSLRPSSRLPASHASESGAGSLRSSLARSRIPGMDALRVGAVVAVMASHAGVIEWGFGLKVLLVFSGFLITRMLLDEHARSGTLNVPRFAWHRATRLLPAMLLYAAAGALYLLARDKPVPWAAALSVLAQVHNYFQGLTGAPSHYLSHAWSLSLQEQFYVVWPLFLLWALRRGMRLDLVICAWIAGVWGVRAFEHLVLHAPDAYLYRALETRSDNLAVGALLAVLLRQGKWVRAFERLRPLAPALVIGLGLAVLQSVKLDSTSLTYRYVVGLAVEPLLIALALPCVILMAGSGGWLGRAMNASFLQKAGQASYAMYLWHQIVMHACFHLLSRRGWAPWPAFTMATLAVGVLGHASFTWWETPVRAWLEARSAHWFHAEPPAG